MGIARTHGYVGCAQTTLNKVGRTPIPATWLPRIQVQSPGEERSLVIGLSPDTQRPAHILLLAPEDVAEALAMLERFPNDTVRNAVWRRFNRHAVQITRDGSDQLSSRSRCAFWLGWNRVSYTGSVSAISSGYSMQRIGPCLRN